MEVLVGERRIDMSIRDEIRSGIVIAVGLLFISILHTTLISYLVGIIVGVIVGVISERGDKK